MPNFFAKIHYLFFVSLLSFFCFYLGACSTATSVPVTEAWRQPLNTPTNYTVKKGDTLYSIAWNYALDFRQVAILNNIKSPYHIIVGQKLRLENVPLSRLTHQPSTAKTPTSAKSTGRTQILAPSIQTTKNTVEQPTSQTTQEEKQIVQSTTENQSEKIAGITWCWPTNKGKLLQCFSCNSLNKGIDIIGCPGTPVLAAATGKVVYAGNGLRGYGEMLIIKHNDTFLSAYAHNQKLLVHEGQLVHSGQTIALMGDTDARRTLLHFEIRQNGKPVDPLKYLPKR